MAVHTRFGGIRRSRCAARSRTWRRSVTSDRQAPHSARWASSAARPASSIVPSTRSPTAPSNRSQLMTTILAGPSAARPGGWGGARSVGGPGGVAVEPCAPATSMCLPRCPARRQPGAPVLRRRGHEFRPTTFRELGDGPFQVERRDRWAGRRRRFEPAAVRRLLGERGRHLRGPDRLASQVVEALVRGEPIQPRAERRLFPEAAELAMCQQEDLLQQILGVGDVPEHPIG